MTLSLRSTPGGRVALNPAKRLLVLGALLTPRLAAAQVTVVLHAGLVITHSVRVVPRSYRLPAPASLDSAVVTIRGDNIVVDFSGATLEGSAPSADPDRAAGVAIRVEGGRNVRILRARIRGYRIGILARETRGLDLIDNDASDTWKPRLLSVVEHESLVDWLSFHHNEKDEWLRYGAGFYLSGVSGGELRGNHAERGMNGLLLVRSDHLRIRENDVSFNSGLGIGLYRSSDNTIVGNRMDYDVRGYSHGFYRRGQDSAGLLLYEQSDRNVVAGNSATHGGDGLFLWAGQSTMDTGEGGANDNLFYGNDFSFAPANAMEATFSRNAFVANRAEGSDYGLWGGYSFESKVVANCFVRNRIGIAIEHGQDNVIAANRFEGDSAAIRVWADSIEPSDWGYPKHRDTRSRDYRIEGNRFAGNRVVVDARNTAGIIRVNNDSAAAAALECAPPELPAEFEKLVPRILGVAGRAPGPALARRDRSAIVVDEWGPYDWRQPKLWPLDSTRAVPLQLGVLGPAGAWRVVSRRGLEQLSKSAGRIGDTLSVTPAPDSRGDWSLELEYRGGAGKPSRFRYERFEPATDWAVRFWSWSDSTDLRRGPERFAELSNSLPILSRRESRLDYEWYRPAIKELPRERFALEATAAVSLPPGEYTLRTISDDGVRVSVDGRPVIDHWTPHESALDYAALAGGSHQLRVQYYQVDGWTELRVEILKGAARSSGSPGPH